jgi:hypothetical protein
MEKTERIKASILRNPSAPNYQIAKNLAIKVDEVARVRAEMGHVPTEPQQDQGLLLSKLRVLPRRPAESAAKYIKRLPLGRGFDVRKLAQEWGMGEDTIRRHAKDLGCLKYVEVEPDEWVPVIMNPETAKQYV